MGLVAYFRAVWWRALKDAWATAIPHTWGSTLRSGFILLASTAAMIFADSQFQIVGRGLMSADNIKDNVITLGIFVPIGLLACFAGWFFIEGLFLVPYKMWKEAKETKATGDTLIATGVLGPLPPAAKWAALPEVDEGAKKNAAKEKIVQAARRHLGPAKHVLVPYFAAARDSVARNFPNGQAKNAIVRGCDHAHGEMSQATKVSSEELQSADKVAKLTLHEAVSNYYYNFCNYMRGVQLTAELLKAGKPPQGLADQIRIKHDAWRSVHDAMTAEHQRLAAEDLHLDLLRTMHDQAGLKIPEIDWDKLANP